MGPSSSSGGSGGGPVAALCVTDNAHFSYENWEDLYGVPCEGYELVSNFRRCDLDCFDEESGEPQEGEGLCASMICTLSYKYERDLC